MSQLLLEIVFGTDPKNWSDAFPTSHARGKTESFSQELSVLLITAEHELVGLQHQADQFAEELTGQGYWVQQLVVKGTNHLSIMNTIPDPEHVTESGRIPPPTWSGSGTSWSSVRPPSLHPR